MNIESIIKVYTENINKNNKNGSFCIDNFKFFYKVVLKEEYEKELKGYEIVSKHYKVPKLIYSTNNEKNGLLLYEYNEKVKENKGLLVDFFSVNEDIDTVYIKIINQYKAVFNKTLKYDYTRNADIFFKDRVKTRIDKFYDKQFYLDMGKYNNVVLNNMKVKFNILEIVESIKEYFYTSNRKEFVVISQCDPNDLNICEDGMILDFLVGGYNPIMAEFATFLWYNIAQGEYLSLKYNKKAFEKHSNIYDNMLSIKLLKENEFIFNIREIRKKAINLYIDNIMKPIIEENLISNWYVDFKNYIAMKILAVFNLQEMEENDKILSLSYLSLFYNNEINNVNEFKKFINNLI